MITIISTVKNQTTLFKKIFWGRGDELNPNQKKTPMNIHWTECWLHCIGAVLVSACMMLSITHEIYAQDVPPDTVTAKDVVNDPSKLADHLKWVVYDFQQPQDNISGFLLQNRIHNDTTGIWSHENIFLLLFDATQKLNRGLLITHSGDRTNEGQNWIIAEVTDEKGNQVVEQMFSAGEEEPLQVDYHWDDPNDPNDDAETPKQSLALRYYSPAYGDSLLVVIGFAQPVPFPESDFVPQNPAPDFQAEQVVDRETLKNWTSGIVSWILDIMDQDGGFGYLNSNIDMWTADNSAFRSGATYMIALSTTGQMLFHGQTPEIIDLTRSRSDSLDLRGQKFIKEFIDIALSDSKEGFYEYWVDDPQVEGDEDSTAAPKVAYVKFITHERIPGAFSDGTIFIGTSNIISSPTSVQELPTGTSTITLGNYPNPFSGTTNLYFNLEESAEVEIEVIDLLGRTMLKHAIGQIPSGIISDYEIDSEGWAPGVYYYRITTTTGGGPTIHAGKMMVAR